MFKKIMNSVMGVGLTLVMASSWADLIPTNSLFFFGEPEYPFEK